MTIKSDTYMLWQNNDPSKDVTVEMTIRWGIEHFERKYQQPVVHISCHKQVPLSDLVKTFPGITFNHDESIYTTSLLYIYGKLKPEVEQEELL